MCPVDAYIIGTKNCRLYHLGKINEMEIRTNIENVEADSTYIFLRYTGPKRIRQDVVLSNSCAHFRKMIFILLSGPGF